MPKKSVLNSFDELVKKKNAENSWKLSALFIDFQIIETILQRNIPVLFQWI